MDFIDESQKEARFTPRRIPQSPLKFNGKLVERFTSAAPKLSHSIVVVEGNIGSGKAQFLNRFRGISEAEVLEEPIDLWRNKNGKNLLNLMYQDPKQHSFEFQQYVLETMHHLHCQSLEKPVSILERSFLSARYVFIENLRKNGMLTEKEFVELDRQFNGYLFGQTLPKIDLIVYIHTSPEVAHERILRRGREEELSIPVDYLKQLHDRYEEWFTEKKFPIPAPVLKIDGNQPLRDVFVQIDQHKDHILFGWNGQRERKDAA